MTSMPPDGPERTESLSLKDLWEAHPIVFIAGLLIVAFALGFAALKVIQEVQGVVPIQKETLEALKRDAEKGKNILAEQTLPPSRELVFASDALTSEPADDAQAGDEITWNARCREIARALLLEYGYSTHGVDNPSAVRGEKNGLVLGANCMADEDWRVVVIYGITKSRTGQTLLQDAHIIRARLADPKVWGSFEPKLKQK